MNLRFFWWGGGVGWGVESDFHDQHNFSYVSIRSAVEAVLLGNSCNLAVTVSVAVTSLP